MAALNFPASPSGGQEYSANGKTWKWDGTSWKLKYVTSGATSFIGLSDTPTSFTADKWIKVNSGGNGLEWANAPTGGGISGINIKDDQGGTGGNPNDLGNATGLLFNGDGVQASGAGSDQKTITIPGGIQVKNDGTNLTTTCFALDFKGAGVTASRTDATKWITIPGGLQVKDEGSAFTVNATVLDFKGTGVVVTEKSGTGGAEKVVTIDSGGLDEVKDDTTPQLGGNLDLNGKDITGTGNINFIGVLTTRKDDVSSVAQTALKIGRSQNLDSFIVKADGNVTSIGVVESTGFKKTGGLSSQYLKADGSVSTLTTFTTTATGLVPITPGGTTKFLRADGQWQVPAGSSGTVAAELDQWEMTTGMSSEDDQDGQGNPSYPGLDGRKILNNIVNDSNTSASVATRSAAPFAKLGNGMSVDSSGLWTFPTAGKWEVTFAVQFQATGYASGGAGAGNESSTVDIYIETTTDNGANWSNAAQASDQTLRHFHGGKDRTSQFVKALIDVTAVGTHKIRFKVNASANGTVNAGKGTIMTFAKADASGGSGGTSDGNDYVTSAQLGTGADAKKLTLGFTDTTKNRTVDLSSLSTTDTNTTYDISLVDGTDATTKKIRLSSTSPASIDEIIFKQGSYIQLIRSGEELEIKSVAALSGLVDVDYAGQSPTANKILKYSTTVNGGTGGWTLGDDNSGSNNTDTTYSISCADGDNVDEEKIRLTAGGDGSGNDDIVLEAGNNMTVSRSGDKITFNSSYSDTDQFKNLSDTPNAYDNGKYLKSTTTGTEWATVTSGVDKLKDLSDTPTGYDDGKYLKSTASGTEWATVTSGSSYTFSAQDHGSDIKKKIIRLTDGTTNQDVTIKADSYLSISRAGNEIELDCVMGLGGLSDVDYQGGSPSDNKILKYNSSVNGGKWVLADDATGGAADGNTTYSLEALVSPGVKLTGSDNSNDSVFFDAGTGITLTRTNAPGASGGGTIKFEATTFGGEAAGLVPASTSGETTKFLRSDGSWQTAGGGVTVQDEGSDLSTSATKLNFAGGMVAATGTGATKTITIAQPTLTIADGSTVSQKKLKLGRGTDAEDEIILQQGSYIELNRSGQTLEIKSVQALSGLSDVSYQGGSPSNNKILKYSTSVGGGKWILADDNTGSSADGNNYVSSASWTSSNGNLTLNRSGLSAITLGISNLQSYFDNRYSQGGISISGSPSPAGAVIRWDGSGWEWSRTALIDGGTSSNHTNLTVHNNSSGYGGVEIDSGGQCKLKKAGTSYREGGHLQFEDEDGNSGSFAIDVYSDDGSTTKRCIRVIDQSSGTQRFCVNHYGAFGIGHTAPDYGSTGEVMISRGQYQTPYWGSHGNISGSAFATTAQGATADTANTDIDNIYNQLNAIGNDASITTVAQLKSALAALTR